jgi:serine protease Do
MLRRLFVLVTFISIGFAAGLVLTGRMRTADVSTAAPAAAEQGSQTARVAIPPTAGLPDLTNIAQRAIESVTNISSTQVVRSPMTNDPFFRFFFGDDVYRDRRQQSLGSGVVVSADGYVMTNHHVICGSTDGPCNAPQVRVGLSDKRELRAKVVGSDPLTDIALLKLDATNLPVLPWGDSSRLRVAEWVLAIGNPFQLNQTVTLGIVSATNRRLEGRAGAQYEDFIQTDAAINPGNSGGALINARGELVGINTAIYSESGGYMGIGFAVPSNLARHVMEDVIKYGVVRRGTIRGLQLQPMSPQIAEELGSPNARGALVLDPGPDAAAAGLRRYDIIVEFNGTKLEDASQFIRLVADAEIGSKATLTVVRQGQQRSIRITIEQASGGRARV